MADQTTYIPQNLGPYRVERELGSGAMGTVFEAIHTGLDRAVALKVLRPDMVQDPDSVRRFLREARSIARMDHPNIVSVYDAGEIDGVSYIAMKLLEGESLQSIIARTGPMPLDRVLHVAAQLASALDYAHARDVVHLDVKPANVMVARGDRVTLTDFGIAQALNPGATRSATIAGTPLYMSPEQIQGQEVDCRSDIYSLGLLIYEMCVGRPPFQGQFVTVMYAHLHTPVPDIRATLPDMPDAFVAVINRALAKNPAERFQTAGELQRALERAAPRQTQTAGQTVALHREPASAGSTVPIHDFRMPSEAPVSPTRGATEARPSPTTVERPAPSRRLPLLIGGAVALLVIAAVAIFAVTQLTGGASTGSLAIASQPAGASVSVDGKAVGRAPLTVSKLKTGAHTVALSLPTYDARRMSVQVAGSKTTQVTATLQSWPAKRMLKLDFAALTTGLQKDPNTGKIVLGSPVTTIPRKQLIGKVIYAAAQLQVDPSISARRTVRVSTAFALYDPFGSLIKTFSQLPFNADAHQRVVLTSIRFTGATNTLPPAGQYTVQFVVNGEVFKTLTFAVTK